MPVSAKPYGDICRYNAADGRGLGLAKQSSDLDSAWTRPELLHSELVDTCRAQGSVSCSLNVRQEYQSPPE